MNKKKSFVCFGTISQDAQTNDTAFFIHQPFEVTERDRLKFIHRNKAGEKIAIFSPLPISTIPLHIQRRNVQNFRKMSLMILNFWIRQTFPLLCLQRKINPKICIYIYFIQQWTWTPRRRSEWLNFPFEIITQLESPEDPNSHRWRESGKARFPGQPE